MGSICQSLSLFLSINQSIYQSINLSIYLSIYLSIDLSIYLSSPFPSHLLEEVAHAAAPDAHEHLDEVRPRDGEEGNARLSCDCFGQQSFTGTRRPDEHGSFRYLCTEASEPLGILEELYELHHFPLGLVDAGDVLERDFRHLLVDAASVALADLRGEKREGEC